MIRTACPAGTENVTDRSPQGQRVRLVVAVPDQVAADLAVLVLRVDFDIQPVPAAQVPDGTVHDTSMPAVDRQAVTVGVGSDGTGQFVDTVAHTVGVLHADQSDQPTELPARRRASPRTCTSTV